MELLPKKSKSNFLYEKDKADLIQSYEDQVYCEQIFNHFNIPGDTFRLISHTETLIFLSLLSHVVINHIDIYIAYKLNLNNVEKHVLNSILHELTL